MSQPERKESYYQERIIRWLRDRYPDAFIWKVQAGPYCRQGIPDICAIINGHYFGFEVKRPGGKLTAIQARTIHQIHAAGGTALVVTYPEDAERAIIAWERSEWQKCQTSRKES